MLRTANAEWLYCLERDLNRPEWCVVYHSNRVNKAVASVDLDRRVFMCVNVSVCE